MIRPFRDVSIVETYALDAPLALQLAGALAGRVAADLGARVVKPEPEGGDPVRRIPPFAGETSTTFAFLNAGKQLLPAEGSSALRRRLGEADAAILDSDLHGVSPNLPPVAVVLSLFKPGAVHGPASEFTVTALGGLLDMVGDPDREPLKLGGHQAAYATGLAAFTGMAAALCRPIAAGRIPAETVRVGMLDTVIWLNWKSVPSGHSSAPPSRSGGAAEWQVVRCADGWVALVYQDTDWAALCDIVDDARLRAPCFADRAQRLLRSREVTRIIEERFLDRTRSELHAIALARRLPIGPVWAPREVVADPQNTSRGFFVPVDLDGGVKAAMARLPVIWGGRTFPPGAVPASKRHEAMVADS